MNMKMTTRRKTLGGILAEQGSPDQRLVFTTGGKQKANNEVFMGRK
jgi:hypothetical protein